MPMVTIIMVVAVLLIHIDRNAVASMNPSTRRAGAVPTRPITCSAIRRCRFQRSMVTAIMKPPMKRYTRWLAYDSVTVAAGMTPREGNTTMGSRAVAGMGMASLIHQIAIHTATAPRR